MRSSCDCSAAELVRGHSADNTQDEPAPERNASRLESLKLITYLPIGKKARQAGAVGSNIGIEAVPLKRCSELRHESSCYSLPPSLCGLQLVVTIQETNEAKLLVSSGLS